MRLIFRYMNRFRNRIYLGVFLKFLGGMAELMIPYIVEHIIDNVVPEGKLKPVFLWSLFMIFMAALCALLNVISNRMAVDNSHNVAYQLRQDLFGKTLNLSGSQVDAFGLPSLISRMTSDSYNIQNFVQALQTLCIRAPFMLIGGIIMTMLLDRILSLILIAMIIPLALVIYTTTRKGIPLYRKTQGHLDQVVRIMRENITGIRVVKALSKKDYEKRRFSEANDNVMHSNIKAGTMMAVPGPFLTICLNGGLVLVILVGARRVDAGLMKPGVILSFLTYFNTILHSVQQVNRIFMRFSEATASSERIGQVLGVGNDLPVLPASEMPAPGGDEFIRFEHVDFSYTRDEALVDAIRKADARGKGVKTKYNLSGNMPVQHVLRGEGRTKCLYDIDFAIRKGESLGVIGPTGCGKSSIVNLLMRFYDVESGRIYIDGKDVRSYELDDLRKYFGVVFQNDTVFMDTLRDNIEFGRGISDEAVWEAVEDAMAAEYIRELDEKLDYEADIKGANLSGGQKQRLLVARALVGKPRILVLDDSSSALDYRTDSMLRNAISRNYPDSTLIMIAQRVSSVQNMTHILVLDEGRVIGYGSHEELLKNCDHYREIFEAQMGSME